MSYTLWFTGLSGAGKTTLSSAAYKEIRLRGLNAVLLDGDAIRRNLSNRLTFSREDRNINVRRLGFISHLLNRNGVVSVVAAIAPYKESRASNRKLLDDYVEVFCNCTLQATEARDPKGLYARARRGEIERFTGVSDPYEIPENPEVDVRTYDRSVDESVQQVLDYLNCGGLLPAERVLAEKDFIAQEENWADRLADLGYLSNDSRTDSRQSQTDQDEKNGPRAATKP